MKSFLLGAFALFSFLSSQVSAAERVILVLHGGAGVKRAGLTAEREARMREGLAQALKAGQSVLRDGGTCLEAVQTSIEILEDHPDFNAGRGAVLNGQGRVEMDASLMDGATRNAGAVAGVKTVRHPIRLAHEVMMRTPHVLLVGDGAEALAREQGLRLENPEWFILPEQLERLKKVRQTAEAEVDISFKVGTVGAVALDREGHLAAGTSTGGLMNKRAGRVGDSPIIGAGTYAEDGVCGVSCTGHGEFFIRNVVAYEVAARMKHAGQGLHAAAQGILHEQLKAQGGYGGLIALDAKGRMTASFNTEGMFHAWVTESGKIHVSIFEEHHHPGQ